MSEELRRRSSTCPSFGKFINAGQTCVAPDYALVHESREREFLDALKAAVARFYGDTEVARAQSPDFARIVDAAAFRRRRRHPPGPRGGQAARALRLRQRRGRRGVRPLHHRGRHLREQRRRAPRQPGPALRGVGASGMGSYHGIHGFRAFSHERAVLVQGMHSLVKLLYPPYAGKMRAIAAAATRLFE